MDTTTKKKILYVITKSNWGGAQRYVYDLASGLKEEYEIAVAFGGEGELKKRLETSNIQTIPIKNLERDVSLLNEFRVFFSLFGILKSFRPDIVHLNSSKIGGLGGMVGRFYNLYLKIRNWDFKLKTKIIFTAHGWVFNESRKSPHKVLAKLLHRATIIFSHHTICVSRAAAYQIGGVPSMQNKISVIHNGITKTHLHVKNEAQELLIQKSHKLQGFFGTDLEKRKKTTWIGTISELHNNKGLEYSIEALSLFSQEHRSFVFLIIGDGEERERLLQLVEEKELSNNVIFMGRVENAIDYLKAFNIFTLTSITEGLPYAILEAGMAELPVVASNIGGIPEIIEQLNSGILVRPRHPEEIKDAITFLQDNKMKGRDMAKKLKLKIQNEFTLEKMIGETKKVYGDTLLDS